MVEGSDEISFETIRPPRHDFSSLYILFISKPVTTVLCWMRSRVVVLKCTLPCGCSGYDAMEITYYLAGVTIPLGITLDTYCHLKGPKNRATDDFGQKHYTLTTLVAHNACLLGTLMENPIICPCIEKD